MGESQYSKWKRKWEGLGHMIPNLRLREFWIWTPIFGVEFKTIQEMTMIQYSWVRNEQRWHNPNLKEFMFLQNGAKKDFVEESEPANYHMPFTLISSVIRLC